MSHSIEWWDKASVAVKSVVRRSFYGISDTYLLLTRNDNWPQIGAQKEATTNLIVQVIWYLESTLMRRCPSLHACMTRHFNCNCFFVGVALVFYSVCYFHLRKKKWFCFQLILIFVMLNGKQTHQAEIVENCLQMFCYRLNLNNAEVC